MMVSILQALDNAFNSTLLYSKCSHATLDLLSQDEVSPVDVYDGTISLTVGALSTLISMWFPDDKSTNDLFVVIIKYDYIMD